MPVEMAAGCPRQWIHAGDAGYLDDFGPLVVAACGCGSVAGRVFLLLVEHLHEAGGRFFIQPGGDGGGPETVAVEPAAQPSQRLDVCGAGCGDLEPDGQGTKPPGDRLVKIPERLA